MDQPVRLVDKAGDSGYTLHFSELSVTGFTEERPLNIRAKQALMLVGWLLILGLTIYASVSAPSDVIPMFISPWTLPPWTLLVLTDLLVELTILSVFIYCDSKRRGKNPWAWIVVALILGAVGTLGYLLARSFDKDAPPILGSKQRESA